MTDLLHKPKGQNDPINQMSEEDWKEYFRLREELDVEYTKEELIKAFDKVDDLLEPNRFEDADNLTAKLPILPRLAYVWKYTLGLKKMCYLNLSEAKKEYPEEF